jgi:hypothetical protein
MGLKSDLQYYWWCINHELVTSASEVRLRIVAVRDASAAAALFLDASSWLSRRNILQWNNGQGRGMRTMGLEVVEVIR